MPLFFSHRPNTLTRCYVPRGQIGPSAFTEIFVFVSGGTTGRGSQRRLLAATGLNTAFFVRRDDELTRIWRASLANAIIQVEDAPGLGREIRVAWEDPTAMPPGAERIGAEPAPQGGTANLRYQPLGDHFTPNPGKRKSRQRQLQVMWEFTGESLNLDDDAGGKSGRVGRPEVAPRGRETARGQIAYATC
jgi:hypothetical protein